VGNVSPSNYFPRLSTGSLPPLPPPAGLPGSPSSPPRAPCCCAGQPPARSSCCSALAVYPRSSFRCWSLRRSATPRRLACSGPWRITPSNLPLRFQARFAALPVATGTTVLLQPASTLLRRSGSGCHHPQWRPRAERHRPAAGQMLYTPAVRERLTQASRWVLGCKLSPVLQPSPDPAVYADVPTFGH